VENNRLQCRLLQQPAKTGNEFSIVGGLTYNFNNPYNDYQNGIDSHLDWAASHFLSKNVLIGVVGYYFQQLTGDSGTGATLGDFKGRVVGIGPQIGFMFPAIKGARVSMCTRRRWWPACALSRTGRLGGRFAVSRQRHRDYWRLPSG
jgi:Putative MetA-pathway of phenol degradation